MTHVLKCVTDLIRCSGGAGSPEHRSVLTSHVSWPWSSRGRGHGSGETLIRCSGGAHQNIAGQTVG